MQTWSHCSSTVQYNNETLVMTEKETGLFDVEDKISCEKQLDIDDLVFLFPILVFLALLLAFAKGEDIVSLYVGT